MNSFRWTFFGWLLFWRVSLEVVIRGFAAIKNKVEVKFDKHTNLLDGPAYDVKQAIISAIDFVLNSSYQDENLASQLSHKECLIDKSYVTVHISGDVDFELNQMDGKKFELTRFLTKNRIGSVYVSCNGQKPKEQDIQAFHNQLNLLQFTRMDDVLISERSCPTSSDLNEIFVGAMNLKEVVEGIKVSNFLGAKSSARSDNESRLLLVLKRQCAEGKSHLTELRTLEAAILMNEINEMDSKCSPDNHAAREKQREIALHLQAAKFENVQLLRFYKYAYALHRISELESLSAEFMVEVNDLFKEFMVCWKKYTEDMKNAREIQWEYDKYVQMNKMKTMLGAHFNQRVTPAEFAKDCEKKIDAAQNRLRKMQQNEDYKLTKRLAAEMSKDIEDRRNAVNDEITKLKGLEQKCLDNEIERSKSTRDFVTFTNQMAPAQLTIEQFFLRQTLLNPICIESWRAGFMALTLETAYAKEIPQNFAGNVLDFINPNTSNDKLNIALPLLCQYFAMFFFKTKSVADAFSELVKHFLTDGLHIYTHVITEDVDETRLANLPFTSLADQVLSDATQAEYPLITNWFNNIRIFTQAEAKPEVIRRLAIKHRCKIIFNNKCFHEDGNFTEIFNGKTVVGAMEEFLVKWQVVAVQRNMKLKLQGEKFKIDKKKAATERMHSELVERIGNLITIADGMKDMVRNTDMLAKYADLEMEQKIQTEINRKKKELLEEGNATPHVEFKETAQVPQVEAIAVDGSIIKFEKNALKIVDSFITTMVAAHPDALAKLKPGIEELQRGLSVLETFDYKRQFEVTMVQSKEDLKELCIEIDRKVQDHSEILKQLKTKTSQLNAIKKYPQLVNMQKANDLAGLSLQSLRDQKQAAFGFVPSKALLLPKLDADFKQFQSDYEGVDEYDVNMPKVRINVVKMSTEMFLVALYFYCLQNVLSTLNETIDGRDEVIGLEIDSKNGSVYMFPDTTVDEAWCNQFAIKNLCGLTFVGKMRDNNDTIITSDLLSVKSPRFCLLLHMILSVWKNPSVIILNKNIIGHPVDSLRKIIYTFQLVSEIDNLARGPQFASRQMIVVESSPGCYRELFQHNHKVIQCNMEGNKAFVTYKNVRKA
ncbi:uncharacterized protein LOC129574751 [Sitodiplosis mosellana]|uniref:uncharacterized protein LOC129574751 n=1 Tax=Sitodiplosis mosellana TaxID=263140 RepID=UPI002443FD8E|nr:uncharacterized protein LOC129574751 [Sitodiplosis mosellana]